MPYVEASGAPGGWLLCNGQEVAGVTYPQLSAVIGETFGSTNTGVSFKLPDYINSSLYGVGSTPASSTTFSVASGLNSSLSAQGTLFIIKSVADSVTSSTVTIQSGLSAVVSGVEVTGTAVSPLTGNMVIGIDSRGSSSKETNAGGGGDATSSTFWFDDPVEIFNQTGLGGTADYSFSMSFSPTLYSYNGTVYTDTGISVPSIASAIIINAYVFDDATQKFQNTELVYAKNETNLLDSTKHYRIMSSYGIPKNYDTRVASQVMLPLGVDASTNELVGAFKYKSYVGQQISLNAIGYII
jgi:microcystin-dependent protein